MKPTLIISDVHGTVFWKDIVAERRPGERVIFLGDYYDKRGNGPFADDEDANFNEICLYAKNNPETYLLVGNHDFQHTIYSSRPMYWTWREYGTLGMITANKDSLQMVLVDRSEPKPVIFSHGGLTQTFMNLHGLKTPEEVNDLWLNKPKVFEWIKHDPMTGTYSHLDGDNIWQSPIWARDMALMEDGVPGFDQVVGHTVVSRPEWFDTAHGDRFLLTCTLDDTLIRLGE